VRLTGKTLAAMTLVAMGVTSLAATGASGNQEGGARESARGGPIRSEQSAPCQGRARSSQVLFYDDVESGVSGWTSEDLEAIESYFHTDSYMAYGGSGESWWCGTFDYDSDGGYGNNWSCWLQLPPVDMSGYDHVFLSYAYRSFCEYAWNDATVVWFKTGGMFDKLDEYCGTIPWTETSLSLDGADNPLDCRFHFYSDGAYSDEDGMYPSVGGGFMCDDVTVFDQTTGTVLFLDDAGGGGLCTPGVPASPGDWWHIIDRKCPAASDPHSWWCGDDADTGLVPPNLRNRLVSPAIDITGVTSCTLHYAAHFEVPPYSGDYLVTSICCDGSWSYPIDPSWSWADFAQCYGWDGAGLDGFDLTDEIPPGATELKIGFTFISDHDGCGPGIAGGAGVMIDDISVTAPTTGIDDGGGDCVLACNRPNPFGRETWISYLAPVTEGKVTLAIYSVQGTHVKSIVDEPAGSGWQSVVWDGTNAQDREMPSGVYFARLEAGGKTAVDKMVLLR
jgi:hypothetical protein